MAKKSKIARDRQRRNVVASHAECRAELKAVMRRSTNTAPAREQARAELAAQPPEPCGCESRAAARAVRLHNRDAVDGRPRGYLRAFGLSRVRMREMAHANELPGVNKAGW